MQKYHAMKYLPLLFLSFALHAEPFLTVPPDEAFSGWDNAFCATSDKHYNGCLHLLGSSVHAANSQWILIHRSQLSEDWEVVKNAQGVEILDHPELLVVKETEKRRSKLTELLLTNRREGEAGYKFNDRLQEAIWKLPARPNLDFEKIRNVIFDKLVAEEDKAKVYGLFYLARLRDIDPYIQAIPQIVEQPYRANGFSFAVRGDQGKLFFARVRPGSPLDQAGAATGDELLEIRGHPVNAKNFWQYMDSKSPGFRIKFRTFKGDVIEYLFSDSGMTDGGLVDSHILNVNGKRLGIVALRSFDNHEICDRTREVILQLSRQKIEGLIYDLRSNMGGRLDQGTCFLGLNLGGNKLVGRRPLVKEGWQYARVSAVYPSTMDVRTSGDRVLPNIPVVVLMNSSSGSMAEVVAAILKEQRAAWLVGNVTYGKGILQAAFDHIDGFQMKVTIQRFDLLDGHSFQAQGVIPDFHAPVIPGLDDERWAWRLADQVRAEFSSPKKTEVITKARAARRKALERCIPNQSLFVTSDQEERWIQDNQLRVAVGTLLCERKAQRRD